MRSVLVAVLVTLASCSVYGDDKGCDWKGQHYALGEEFPDQCNTCTCTDHGVSCTIIACGPFVDANLSCGIGDAGVPCGAGTCNPGEQCSSGTCRCGSRVGCGPGDRCASVGPASSDGCGVVCCGASRACPL